jgi:hypothetical protein
LRTPVRLGDALPHGQLAAPGDGERQVRRDGERDRVDGTGAVEPQDVGGGRGRRDRRVERVVEPVRHDTQRLVQRAMHLVAGHDRGDHRCAAGAGDLAGRQHRRDHAARMAAAAGKAVVAVEIARHRGIGEGGELGQRATRGAEHARAEAGFTAQRQRSGDAARLGVERRDRAAERVGDPPLAGVDRRGGEIGKTQAGRELGDAADGRVCTRRTRHRPLSRPVGHLRFPSRLHPSSGQPMLSGAHTASIARTTPRRLAR